MDHGFARKESEAPRWSHRQQAPSRRFLSLAESRPSSLTAARQPHSWPGRGLAGFSYALGAAAFTT
jgi:hypothetical protein